VLNPALHGERLHRALVAAGVASERRLYADAGHNIYREAEAAKDMMTHMLVWTAIEDGTLEAKCQVNKPSTTTQRSSTDNGSNGGSSTTKKPTDSTTTPKGGVSSGQTLFSQHIWALILILTLLAGQV
jgi:hypothetical protein